MAGIELLHVPYRGTGPAVNDLLGGQINMLFSPPQVVAQHIAAGKLRMIGTTGSERSALFPDIPTIAETGLPEYSVARLVRAVRAGQDAAPRSWPRSRPISATVLKRPTRSKRLATAGAEPAPNSPDGVHDVRQQGHRQVARPGRSGRIST